jgi:Ca2+/Na+ antiporter
VKLALMVSSLAVVSLLLTKRGHARKDVQLLFVTTFLSQLMLHMRATTNNVVDLNATVLLLVLRVAKLSVK